LFYRVDEAINDIPKHPQARLYPSEVVTLSLLFVLTGSGERAFYRWLERDYRPLFPQVPARTRLFRLFATHQDGADRFLAEPTIFGVADSDGVEVTHPYREQRRRRLTRSGRTGVSNHRWIVGGTLGVVLTTWGLVCAWGADTANVHDSTVHPLRRAHDRLRRHDSRAQGGQSVQSEGLRAAPGTTACSSRPPSPCSRRSAMPRTRASAPGAISPCAWPPP